MDIEELRKKAKNGDIEAMKDLAHAYRKGESVSKNRAHYIKWLTIAAERGDVDAQMELIKFYSDKRSKYSNPEKAVFWMRKAQEQKVEKSILSEIDMDNAKVVFEKSMQLSKTDKEVSRNLLFKAASLGSIEALTHISSFSPNAIKNSNEAIDINKWACLLIKAANTEKEKEIGTKLIKLSVDYNGNEQAMANYIYCALNGIGMEKNLTEAAGYYLKIGEPESLVVMGTGKQGRSIRWKLPETVDWEKAVQKAHEVQKRLLEEEKERKKRERKRIEGEEVQNIQDILDRADYIKSPKLKVIRISIAIILSAIFTVFLDGTNWDFFVSAKSSLMETFSSQLAAFCVIIAVFTTVFYWIIRPFMPSKLTRCNADIRKELQYFEVVLPPFEIVKSETETISTSFMGHGDDVWTNKYLIRFLEENAAEQVKGFSTQGGFAYADATPYSIRITPVLKLNVAKIEVGYHVMA